jgi:RimJ/RimL family protein N-acetyltransferase
MELVDCGKKYWLFVLHLRNTLRFNFIEQGTITENTHEAFMSRNYGTFKICLSSTSEPIGFIGCVNGDIRIAVDPKEQEKGVGKFMLKNFVIEDASAFAKIKVDNEASLNLFESCGYKKKYYILENEKPL